MFCLLLGFVSFLGSFFGLVWFLVLVGLVCCFWLVWFVGFGFLLLFGLLFFRLVWFVFFKGRGNRHVK